MRFGRSTLMRSVFLAVFAVLLCVSSLPAQSSKPITFKGLVGALNEHGLTNAELADIVRSRGVDFVLDARMVSELKSAGASSALIAAVRSSYRGSYSPSRIQPPSSHPRETAAPSSALGAVQTLFDQKRYDDARASFDTLPGSAKTTFDGQLLLCRIEQERKQFRLAVQACNSAIQSRPDSSLPYGLNGYALLVLGDLEQADAATSKAVELSNDPSFKNLLGIIHYSEEKYGLVPKDISADSNDAFLLGLLTGAAFHNRDYNSFGRLRAKITSLKGNDNGWTLFVDGLNAQRDLNWDLALQKFKKCDADSDFIDPICLLSAARVEFTQGNYSDAKSDIDKVLSAHPRYADAVSEGIFINLRVGHLAEADRLHGVMNEMKSPGADSIDCLYYYGRNQPLLATSHCLAAVRADQNDYGAWDNAGYAALDNGDFQSAISYFAQSWKLFYASKDKHTVNQELDLWWGTIAAEYYSGNKKLARDTYRTLKKTYPQFATTLGLKQLPLLWSDATVKLIDRAIPDLQ